MSLMIQYRFKKKSTKWSQIRLNSNAVPVLELKHAIISKEFGGKLPKPNHDLLLQNKATGEM